MRVFLKFHFRFALLKQRNSFCRAQVRTIFAPQRDESRVFSKFHFQFTLLKQRNSFCRAQARTIFAPQRDGMRRAQYRFRTLRHRRTGSASRRTPPARRGIFIFSRKNEIVLDFFLAMWYNSMELKVNTVFTRRSRVAGRARTIGNRVTVKSGSRVRISPSPPQKALCFECFFAYFISNFGECGASPGTCRRSERGRADLPPRQKKI